MHRDAAYADNKPMRTKAVVNGFETAQLMFVCGIEFDHWKGNLGVALGIHDLMQQRYPGIMRSLLLREARYNQDLTPGSVLEVRTDRVLMTIRITSVREHT